MAEPKQQPDNALVPFSKLNKGIAEMKKKFAKVPAVETKEGYEIVKGNLKEYRSIKKRVEDTYKIAVEDINDIKSKLLGEKKRLIGIVEEVFEPHKEARKVEDERLETIKREKAEARAKRDREIKGRIDDMRESYATAVSSNSDGILDILEIHKNLEITEELFGDDLEIGKAVHSAMMGKLKSLYESKLEQEELQTRLMQEAKDLEQQRHKQQLEDEKRDKEQREKDEAERKRMAEENAKLKAENEKMQAERKKLDDEKAEIEAEKQKLEDAKIKAKEEAEWARQAEFERLAKIAQEEKEAKEQAKREVKEQKDREAKEKKAKKEARERRVELVDVLKNYIPVAAHGSALISAIEKKEIPYLRIDWTEK